MKKTLILAIALTLVFAGVAFGGVVNSKHDMSIEDTLNTAATAVCEFCHHPHKGTTGTNLLLWNKSYGTNTYASYQNTATMAATPANVNMASFASNGQYATALCMSCHDGAASDNQYIRASGGGTTSANITLTGAIDLGSTLADDHPVNFAWDTATPPDATIQINVATYPLYNAYFQCGTCHNVHNAGTTPVQFLRKNNTDSIMCTDCHTAK